MSTASIIAFLAFLSAFNIPTTTVQSVSDILYASQASTTQVVATTTLQVTPHSDAVVSTSTVNNLQTQPTFGSTIQTMPQDLSAINIVRIDQPNPRSGNMYAVVVQVLGSDGKPTPHASVHAELPNGLVSSNWNGSTVDQNTNTQSTPNAADWTTTLAVEAPKGTALTITSGQLSKVVTLP